jgi:hypothetical protein
MADVNPYIWDDVEQTTRQFDAATDKLVGIDEVIDDRVSVLIQDAGGITKSYNDAGNQLTLNTAFATKLLNIEDQKASGTDGGSFTSGAWRTRVLNTVKTNEITGASLAANQITLPAGTYYCEWSCPAFSTSINTTHQTKLANITSASDVIIGSSERGVAQTRSIGSGRFTLGASSALELQHRISVTRNTDGFGNAAGFGVVEVYSTIKIWKVD